MRRIPTKLADWLPFRHRLNSASISARIYLKWLRDKRVLPLTPEHFGLYRTIHRYCLEQLGDFPDLVNCRDFNDRIQWLKLFDQSQELIRCHDKLGVREYVKERLGDSHLLRVYQVHNRFSEIDFDLLPNAFVLKTNHDSGTVILVRDKASFDRSAAEALISEALRHVYGRENGEWAYAHVHPKVFAEEMMNPDDTVPPPDFKFHCVDGEVRWLQYIYSRWHGTKEVIAMPDGTPTAIHLYTGMEHSHEFSRPAQFEKMKEIAHTLAKGFKYVRVDMYLCRERIFVGELTFFPMAGCYKGEGQKAVGQLLDFDRSNTKPLFAEHI